MDQAFVDRLEAQGFSVVRAVFAPDEIERHAKEWEAAAAGAISSSLRRTDRFILGTLRGPLGELAHDPRVVALASAVLGPDLALYHARLLVKDHVWNGPVAPHQDMPYFHGGTRKLSLFVPLGRVDRGSGGLWLVPGSHRYGNLGIRGTIQLEQFPGLRAEQPLLEPGDVLAMDFLTWHYSEAKEDSSTRCLLQLSYQPASDGSWDPRYLDRPTLVAGAWQTERFLAYGHGVLPDLAPGAHDALQQRSGLGSARRLWRRLRGRA